MSDDLMKKMEQMLHEEKWTRTAISAFSVALIKELDALLKEISDTGILDEAQELCDAHLVESKNSIIALYLSGMISLSKQLLDDTNLVKLVTLFSQNLKWQVVEHICSEILTFGENKFALRSLIDCYRNENNEQKLYETEERLIRVDIEEADIVFNLAQRFEKEKAIEKAIDYYKKAIHRYIYKKNFNKVREIWLKLLEFCPDDVEYFNQVENKVSKSLGSEKSCQLLEDLYPLFIKNKDWDNAIQTQLKINTYENKSQTVRREIIDCLRSKYKDNPKTEEYIRLSNLPDSWKSILDALEDFKKHMAYEKGNFVYHKTWGVGRIREVRGQDFIIDFEKRRDQVMAQKMAVEALSPLPKDDIRVIIATMKKPELKDKIKSDIDWALKIIIKSFGNSTDMKFVKAVLVPAILTPGEWSTWSTNARNILKTSPDFAISPDRQDEYMVRTQPITFEEKTYNKFKVEKDFFDRLSIIEEFIQHGKIESEFFPEMFSSFTSYLKLGKVNEEVVSSFLLVNGLVKKYPFLNPGINKTFSDYFQEIEDLEDLFSKIQSTELRREFLHKVKDLIPTWDLVYVKLFPLALSLDMIQDLLKAGKQKSVSELFSQILERYKEEKEAFFTVAKALLERPKDFQVDFNPEKIMISLVHILDITFRDVNNKKDVSNNKRINKQILAFLFKEKKLEEYMAVASEESVYRIFSLVNDVRELPSVHKQDLRNLILQRFPNFTFYGEEKAKVVSARKGMLATLKMYNSKKRDLQNILDVEVPKNSKEIAVAMALGDLKENAEYHAAKERQTILSATVANLTKELDQATVLEKKDVDGAKVSFGTIVHLKNNSDSKGEIYTILGPWESDPAQNIISYLSPFGDKLLNSKVGDHLKFTINERKCDFLVEKIQIADF